MPGILTAVRVCPRCRSVYVGDLRSCRLDGEALVVAATDPLVGATIERFRLVEPIGEGAMGRVYRARHLFLDKRYAIKVLFGDYAGDSKFRERFRREAQAISKVRHPNIVTVEDFGTTPEGLIFLALELVEGESLQARLSREGRLPPARVRSIGRQIAAGLGAAHDAGFVHRDVKPSNVMVTGDPPQERIKLLDFGTVGLQQTPTDQRLTRFGHLIGTPTYMAPEQAHDPAVGPAADFYALGVILFEMLAGHPPFRGADRAEILAGHVVEPPPPLPESEGLERVVAQLLEKDPRQRPGDAASVLELLAEPSADSRPLFSMMPELSTPELGFREWEQAASLEPYGFDPVPMVPPLEPYRSPPPLAKDLTIDEAALLYEPAIKGGEGPHADTQIDLLPPADDEAPTETRAPILDAADTELEHTPEPASAPLAPVPQLAAVPALLPTGERDPSADTLLDGFVITPVMEDDPSTDPEVETEAEPPPTPRHPLGSMADEATAAVRRRKPPEPVVVEEGGIERWLLPLTVALLATLVAALVNRLFSN